MYWENKTSSTFNFQFVYYYNVFFFFIEKAQLINIQKQKNYRINKFTRRTTWRRKATEIASNETRKGKSNWTKTCCGHTCWLEFAFWESIVFYGLFLVCAALLLCFILHVTGLVFVSNPSAHESVRFNECHIFHLIFRLKTQSKIIKLTGHFDASINSR